MLISLFIEFLLNLRFHFVQFFFFFQAEDGIRDYKVTGVQTWLFRSFCRSASMVNCTRVPSRGGSSRSGLPISRPRLLTMTSRSEERRVGKEGRSRWAQYHLRKKGERETTVARVATGVHNFIST